jgi:hypothetical protein
LQARGSPAGRTARDSARRHQPPTGTLARDVPTIPRLSTVSTLMPRVPTEATPQPKSKKNGRVRGTPADSDIAPGIGTGNELGIGTGTELGSDTGELGSDVPPNGMCGSTDGDLHG